MFGVTVRRGAPPLLALSLFKEGMEKTFEV
jgi:hypothetical protein